MNGTSNMSLCSIISWVVAAIAGILAFLVAREPVSFIAALMVGVALTAFLGLVLTRLFCGADDVMYDAGKAVGGAATATAAGAGAVATKAAETATAAKDAAASAASATAAKAAEVTEAATETAKDMAGAASDKAEAAVDSAGEAAADATDAAVAAASDAADDAKEIAADAADEAEAAVDAAAETASEAKDAVVETATETAEEAKETVAEATPDYDNDGVLEGENEGTRPEALSGPRGGKADNLKEIKGIGPKLEIMCNEMGFYHFDQIAGWTADEVAWVNANLKGFKGRVTRDNWIEQAKILAAGGQTEFSKRVDDGKVY